MLTQGVLALFAASPALAATIGGRYDSSVLKYSSRAIARTVRNCNTPAPPTVYFPLNFRYGSDQKITTDLVIPGTNKTMPVCFDQGSEDFWVAEPGAVLNWGAQYAGQVGPCNTSMSPVYDYSASPDATEPAPYDYFNVYGGSSKYVLGNATVDDTMVFTSVAGQQSTIAGIRTALTNLVSVRLEDESGHCEVTERVSNYDVGILGTAPFQIGPGHITNGPHVRQQFLEQGTIKAAVQSMWMDERPHGIEDTYTGGAIFGGIDLSKFTGPLVKVKSFPNVGDTVGYRVAKPIFSVQGKQITTQSDVTRCFIDSGTRNDAIPIAFGQEEEFYKVTGLVESPTYQASWPGPCESVPSNITIDMRFPGKANGTFVDIKVPLKNYVRADNGEEGLCRLNLYPSAGDCTLAAPFSTAAFFAADDENDEVAFAQGGISKRGSGPDKDSIVLRIP
ncbi:aspartic peptidase domain-containing protein [Xylaria bambusicola]|uniref:aspartic peptidase domain-containing protein n=1 Tax=Xylaria bambusicola TaxID=326684 RepID=UPI0020087E5F|nr:aspartic peptidase domain-containing protein [Xylaria bambusicola]KAI0516963.1 aspartic peptidase domain-containing protein [Xylaria bambusicola]